MSRRQSLGRRERRVEVRGHLVEIEKRLADQCELGRRPHAALTGDAGHLQHHVSGLEIAPHLDAPLHQLADRAAKPISVELIARTPDARECISRGIAVAVADSQQELHDLVAHCRGKPADHAQVDQGEPVVGHEQHIAGMRIGVEEPFRQHLLQVGPEEILDQRGAVEVGAGDRAQVGDLSALEMIHREHAAGAVVRHGARHDRRGHGSTIWRSVVRLRASWV